MGRGLVVVIGLLLMGCQSSKDEPHPDFPKRVVAGTWSCEKCGDIRGQSCGYMLEYACPDGEGSCGHAVPCDPECCPAPRAELVGIDQPPWGPIITAAAADERAPTGMIVYQSKLDLFLLRPDQPTTDPTPLLRLPKTFDAWRWSAADRQLIVAIRGMLYRVDFEQAQPEASPLTPVRYESFDVTASGDRAVVVLPHTPTTHDVDVAFLDLGDGSQERWTLPPGWVESPAWDRQGTRVAFTVDFAEPNRMRVADVEARTVVDSPRDLPELNRPIWHPSGSFLAVCTDHAGSSVLEFIEPDGLRHTETPLGSCPELAFSPDGRHLALLVRNRIEVVKLSAMTAPTTIIDVPHESPVAIAWLDEAR